MKNKIIDSHKILSDHCHIEYDKAGELTVISTLASVQIAMEEYVKLSHPTPEISDEEICCGTCIDMNDGECMCEIPCIDFSEHCHISKAAKPVSEERIDELRDRFFKECTDKDQYMPNASYLRKINKAPHDLFEWFKAALKELNQ